MRRQQRSYFVSAVALLLLGLTAQVNAGPQNVAADFFKSITKKFHKNNHESVKSELKAENLQQKSVGDSQLCASIPGYSVTSLPYWNAGDTLPCMYSGFVNFPVSDTKNNNMFFWLFKNTKTVVSPDLVIWLDGGPGSSSIEGLFIGNGPLRIQSTGTGADDYKIFLNPEGSWADNADVLYIDQPVDSGFSYGDRIPDRMDDGAKDFIKFLDGFTKIFPEYVKAKENRRIFLSGWSYAGKYIPQFSYQIDENNKNNPNNQYNLAGVMIGDPLASPPIMRTQAHKVAQSLNVIDESNMAQVETLRKNCEEQLGFNWDHAPNTCDQILNYITDMSGGLITFDARKFGYDWDPVQNPVHMYFLVSGKKADVYKALNVDKSTKNPIYDPVSANVAKAYMWEKMLDYANWYDKLLDLNIPVLVYAGEWDQRSGPATMEEFLKSIPNLKGGDLWNQARQIYYIKDKSGQFIVGGYFRQDLSKQFTFLTIPKGGHFVAGDQQLVSNTFFNDIKEVGYLQCQKDNYLDCYTTLITCNYMNNCNDKGVCGRNGQCVCDEGYKSADCSEKAELLVGSYNKQFITNGTQWIFFQYKNGLIPGVDYELSFSSQFPLDIYISQGADSDPNEFQQDLAFKKQNFMKLSSKHFPTMDTFVAAVKINGIDFYNTVYYKNSLSVKFNIIQSQSLPNPQSEQQEQQKYYPTEEKIKPTIIDKMGAYVQDAIDYIESFW